MPSTSSVARTHPSFQAPYWDAELREGTFTFSSLLNLAVPSGDPAGGQEDLHPQFRDRFPKMQIFVRDRDPRQLGETHISDPLPEESPRLLSRASC